MKTLRPTLVSITALLSACAATPPTEYLVSSTASAELATNAVRPVAQDTGRARLGATELALWNDPRFQRWFVESYASETEVEPRLTETEVERVREIMDLMSSDKPGKAEALIQKSGGAAASAVFDFMQANLRFQRDDFDGAAKACRRAVEKYPKFLRAWRMLGLIQVRAGDYRGALPALTRVIELGGGEAYTYGGLGYAYANVGNHISAESAYRMANLLDPSSKDWKIGLAQSFFRQTRYADAVALCRTLIEEAPDSPDYWLLQANAYIGLGQPLRAAENYEIVDGLGASTPDSLQNLADIYATQGLFDLAVDKYLAALDLGAPRPERMLQAAKLLTAKGAFDETRRLVDGLEERLAGRLDVKQQKDLLKVRSRLAVAAGAGDEEVHALEEIVALDPLDGEALLLLGQNERRAGELEKAIFYYERAAAIEGFEADGLVRQAQVLAQQEKYSEALPLLRRAQTIDPRDNVAAFLEQIESAARSSSGGAR